MDSCWNILGISRFATKKEIKNAYRRLAKKYHPDLYKNTSMELEAKEKMQEINSAYSMAMKTLNETQVISNDSNINRRINEKINEISNNGDYEWLVKLSKHKGYNDPVDYLQYLIISNPNSLYDLDNELKNLKFRETKLPHEILNVYDFVSGAKRKVLKKIGQLIYK